MSAPSAVSLATRGLLPASALNAATRGLTGGSVGSGAVRATSRRLETSKSRRLVLGTSRREE
jgi:hypothetical protein